MTKSRKISLIKRTSNEKINEMKNENQVTLHHKIEIQEENSISDI